ncbi:MAG: hypothetical protein HOP17_00140, partial [Acidobacteria bacterium]|nr:hypothetical protein [Acidobacteriota bacterium]
MFKLDHTDPRNYFALGLALVVLCLTFPIIPNWRTFIHMWPFELAASIFLLASLAYLICRPNFRLRFHRREFHLILLPITALIAWSAISISWAPSWKSAVHHTLVWSEYLIFYLLVRSVIDSKNGYRKMLFAATAAFVLVSLPAIVEYSSLLVFGGGTSIGLRYARYGEQVNTLVPLVIAGILATKKSKRFVVGIAVAAALWMLIFISLGRTNITLFAVAAASVGGCVFLFKRFHQYRLKVVLILLALLAAPIPLHFFSLFSSDPNIPVLRRVNDDAAIG